MKKKLNLNEIINIIKKMNLKEYLKEMKKYNDIKLNDKICKKHNDEFI